MGSRKLKKLLVLIGSLALMGAVLGCEERTTQTEVKDRPFGGKEITETEVRKDGDQTTVTEKETELRSDGTVEETETKNTEVPAQE